MSAVEKIKLYFPLPIVKLYEAMQLETEPRERTRKLVDLFERTSQYLVFVGLAGYLHQGLFNSNVEELRLGLARPSLGHWVELLKAITMCLRSTDPLFLTTNLDHVYKDEPIGTAVNLLKEHLRLKGIKKVTMFHFLDTVVEFRNKKIGHGELSLKEAEYIQRPFEEAIIQWLGELPTLHERHLLYITEVRWQNRHYVYIGIRLNTGTYLESFQLAGDVGLDAKCLYIHLPTNNTLIPLSPFFVYHPHTQVLYTYSELSNQDEPRLRCPYSAPGAEQYLTLSIDKKLIVGSGPTPQSPSPPASETMEAFKPATMSPEQLSGPIPETEDITFHEDIREDHFDETVFAPDLNDVPIGKDTNEKKRLQRQIENLQKAWDNLEEKKAKLLQDRTHETRRLEADQLSSDIEKIKEQQEKIDNDLSKLEVKLKKIEVEEQQTLEILSKRDAQKSRHQDIVEEANIGLSALADLMQKPEVRDEVVVFRTRFEIVTSQIGILMIYKAIHDRLQILENKSNSLVHHIKDFPGDSGVLFILEDFYTDFQQINGEIIKLAAQVSLNSNIWILMLNEAQENLIKAIESANQRQLDNVFHDIRRILGRLPSEINDQLKSVKLHLHLLDLAETTINIQNDITRFELDIKKVSQFTKGVESLNSLSQELNTLVEDHDQWQKMDNFLHMLKANLDDISKLWTFYKSQLEAIYGNNTERWANLLRKAAEKLDSAIIEENPEDIKLYLQLFHSRVTQHFNWVDVQLKNLCEELVKVGKPLDSILEMMT